MGLLGNILIIVCLRGGASLATNSVAIARSMPWPGLTNTAVKIANAIAIAVVAIYKITVLLATAPMRELLPSDETPQIRETKTKGTTNNFNKRTNICPTVSKIPLTKRLSRLVDIAVGNTLKE
jgi:hypothetical protein